MGLAGDCAARVISRTEILPISHARRAPCARGPRHRADDAGLAGSSTHSEYRCSIRLGFRESSEGLFSFQGFTSLKDMAERRCATTTRNSTIRENCSERSRAGFRAGTLPIRASAGRQGPGLVTCVIRPMSSAPFCVFSARFFRWGEAASSRPLRPNAYVSHPGRLVWLLLETALA